MAEKKKTTNTKSKTSTSEIKKGNPEGTEKTKIIIGLVLAVFTIYLFMAIWLQLKHVSLNNMEVR